MREIKIQFSCQPLGLCGAWREFARSSSSDSVASNNEKQTYTQFIQGRVQDFNEHVFTPTGSLLDAVRVHASKTQPVGSQRKK